MEPSTIQQVDDRITEIDDLIFRGTTGQIPMLVAERDQLRAEGKQLAELLAKALSEVGLGDYQTLYDAREMCRSLNQVAAVSGRYVELHPEPQPAIDVLVDVAMQGVRDGTKTSKEASEILATIFGTVFVPLTDEVVEPPPPLRLTRLGRILKWLSGSRVNL